LRKRRPFTSATSIRRSIGEGVERAHQIAAVDADVEREVVAGTGWNADEGKVVRESDCGYDGERPVAAGGAERVRAARHRVVDERCEVVVRAQDDHVDAELERPLGEAGARRLAATGLGVDEQHGPPRPIRAVAAGTLHPERPSLGDRRDCSVGGP
jgi:hypothetical protein